MPHRPLRNAVLGAAIAVAVAGCATTKSSTGRTQYVGAVSQQQLDQLGAQAFDEVKSKKPLAQDGRQSAYLSCVVDAIAAQLPENQRRAWEEAVFVDKNPNAFALPGGKVGVYTGLFDVAKNQDQLAAVVGHEIGHVVERHHDERITRAYGAQAALTVAGLLTDARYGQGAARGVAQGGGLLLQTTFLLPGTRAQETEADIVGQRLMAQAGFDPRQAVALWQNMIAATQGGARPPEWLSTHPDPKARIGELRKRAEQLLPTYEQARAAGRQPKCG
jgi:predicted Zn-dependent protease